LLAKSVAHPKGESLGATFLSRPPCGGRLEGGGTLLRQGGAGGCEKNGVLGGVSSPKKKNMNVNPQFAICNLRNLREHFSRKKRRFEKNSLPLGIEIAVSWK
jgi:hypothetical protein